MDCTGSFGVVYTGALWTVTGLYLAAVLDFIEIYLALGYN